MCAKYYENPTMFSQVITKNVGDVFLRHTVHQVHSLLSTGMPNFQDRFT